MKGRSSFEGVTPSPARGRSSLGSLRSSLGSDVGMRGVGASMSLVPLPRSEAVHDPLMGAKIKKHFGATFYIGQVAVIDYDSNTGERAYHVVYEDGDEEHLSAAEVRRTLVMPGLSAACSTVGSRRVSAAAMPFSGAPTPRPSTGSHTAPQRWYGSQGVMSNLPSLAGPSSFIVAMLTAVGVIASMTDMSFGFASVDNGESSGAVAGLSPPLPPWAQLAPEANSEQHQWLQGDSSVVASAPLHRDSSVNSEQKHPGSDLSQSDTQHAEVPALPAWMDKVPSNDEFARLPDEKVRQEKQEKSAPASQSRLDGSDSVNQHVNIEDGKASSTTDAVHEREVAAAASALADASGLLVSAVSNAFVGQLEDAWQFTSSGFSAATDLFGSVSFSPDDVFVSPGIDEEYGTGDSLESLVTFVLAASGILIILVSVFPSNSRSFSHLAGGHSAPVPVAGVAGQLVLPDSVPLQAAPSPQQMVSAPSPIQQGPGPALAPSPIQQGPGPAPAASPQAPPANSPGPAVTAPSPQLPAPETTGAPSLQAMAERSPLALVAVTEAPAAAPALATPIQKPREAFKGARTLMALMGRTPKLDSEALQFRPPPPPPSLMLPPPVPTQNPQIQVNAWYIEAEPLSQERVVKVVAVRQDSVFAQPYVLNRLRSGKITFTKDRRFSGEVLIKSSYLKEGPFHIAPGGRAPAHINARFGALEEDVHMQMPPPQWGQTHQSAACPSCGSVYMADAVYCRQCGRKRDMGTSHVVPGLTTPVPSVTPGTAVGRLKSKFVIEESRFRHTAALNKLKEMGFDDCPELRELITKWNGNLSYAIREINGSPVGDRA